MVSLYLLTYLRTPIMSFSYLPTFTSIMIILSYGFASASVDLIACAIFDMTEPEGRLPSPLA